MVNSSLVYGYFPDTWKEALVKPKLKKSKMDLIKKNYRPVSNLAFLSKVTEIIAAKQKCGHHTFMLTGTKAQLAKVKNITDYW